MWHFMMWHLTACKISVSLSFFELDKKWNDFYRISELMLPTLIQRHDKNHFIFCVCWGFTAQSTQWGHVERSQFT